MLSNLKLIYELIKMFFRGTLNNRARRSRTRKAMKRRKHD